MGQLRPQQQQQEQAVLPQTSSKAPLVKPQLTSSVPDESYCCTTSITPRQRPKPLNAGVVTTPLGSSPVLKRALFPSAVTHSGVSLSPDVTTPFINPSTTVESVEARFQHASISSASPSSMEKAKLNDLFPPYSGKLKREILTS